MLLLETDQDDTDSEDNHAVLTINMNMSVTVIIEPTIFLSTNKFILHGGRRYKIGCPNRSRLILQ